MLGRRGGKHLRAGAYLAKARPRPTQLLRARSLRAMTSPAATATNRRVLATQRITWMHVQHPDRCLLYRCPLVLACSGPCFTQHGHAFVGGRLAFPAHLFRSEDQVIRIKDRVRVSGFSSCGHLLEACTGCHPRSRTPGKRCWVRTHHRAG